MKRTANITIRLARPADAPAIRECVISAYQQYVARIGKQPAPMLADYDELIGREVVHVAEEADRTVGIIVMWSNDDHLYIDNIATTPDARGTGVGSALLVFADEAARDAGHDEIRLYTNVTMVENLDYYPRRGFVETHRSTEDGYNRVYYSRWLEC